MEYFTRVIRQQRALAALQKQLLRENKLWPLPKKLYTTPENRLVEKYQKSQFQWFEHVFQRPLVDPRNGTRILLLGTTQGNLDDAAQARLLIKRVKPAAVALDLAQDVDVGTFLNTVHTTLNGMLKGGIQFAQDKLATATTEAERDLLETSIEAGGPVEWDMVQAARAAQETGSPVYAVDVDTKHRFLDSLARLKSLERFCRSMLGHEYVRQMARPSGLEYGDFFRVNEEFEPRGENGSFLLRRIESDLAPPEYLFNPEMARLHHHLLCTYGVRPRYGIREKYTVERLLSLSAMVGSASGSPKENTTERKVVRESQSKIIVAVLARSRIFPMVEAWNEKLLENTVESSIIEGPLWEASMIPADNSMTPVALEFEKGLNKRSRIQKAVSSLLRKIQ